MTYHYWSVNLFDEFSILLTIDVCGETEFLDTTSTRNHHCFAFSAGRFDAGCGSSTSRNGVDLFGLGHDLPCHGTFDRVTGDNDSILLIWRPSLEEFSTHAVLHHTRTCQHDTSSYVVKPVKILQTANVLEIPGTSFVDVVHARGTGFVHSFAEQALDVVVHRADVGLVDNHALSGQVGGVVNGDLLIFWMSSPVLVED